MDILAKAQAVLEEVETLCRAQSDIAALAQVAHGYAMLAQAQQLSRLADAVLALAPEPTGEENPPA